MRNFRQLMMVCVDCRLFLPANTCTVCGDQRCRRCTIKHAKEHIRDMEHLRLALNKTRGGITLHG